VEDWILALYIIFPTYCANGAPVLFGGGRSIDIGRTLPDGQRIFGDHKTFRGLASGLLVGFIVGVLESFVASTQLIPLAMLASLGALLGDLAGAFVKRRLKISPGHPLPGVDQLDFVIGAVLLVSLASPPPIGTILILICVTPPIHLLTNVGAYLLGLKETYC
jgi:CDP-2,3-bis-(O-geranylgeranyl)-sn-glycerol synthase